MLPRRLWKSILLPDLLGQPIEGRSSDFGFAVSKADLDREYPGPALADWFAFARLETKPRTEYKWASQGSES
jgi:hypothetical protein